MNAILGSVENESVSTDIETLMQAHLQTDQLIMNIFMKNVDKKVKAAVKKYADAAAKKAVARVLTNVANSILSSISEATKQSTKAKKSVSTEERRQMEYTNRSNGQRRRWNNYSEDERAAQAEAMFQGRKQYGYAKVRLDELTEEEQSQYVSIANSQLIRETFVLRECRCSNEANQLLGQYLRSYSRENKFKKVHDGNHAMYDIRAIEWLCNNYKNHTFDEATYGSLSYYFE